MTTLAWIGLGLMFWVAAAATIVLFIAGASKASGNHEDPHRDTP